MNHASKLGFQSAVLTALITLGTFVIAVFTPPLSGPLCTGSCFSYPFTGIESRFPRDYYWMAPAILTYLLYLILIACVDSSAPRDKKIFSRLGLIFAAISSTLLITDYFLQLTVIQPSLLSGETDGVAMLSQFNSHGIFIALEELGYLLMSIASLFLAFVFSGDRLSRSIRWTLVLTFALTMIAFAAMCIQYGVFREYRFEIAAITINWLGLIVSSVLLAIFFQRPNKQQNP
jgi:hypothetical protein